MVEYRLGHISADCPKGLLWEQEERLFLHENYCAMRAETKVLWDFSGAHMAWKLLLKSHDEFIIFMGGQERAISVPPEVYLLSSELSELRLECLRLLMNFLASASAFLSISNIEIKRLFSDKTFDEWDKQRKDLHLNSSSYRLGYELRNYAQHYGFPVSEFGAHMSSSTFYKIDLVVHVRELLSKEFNWNRRVKSDLQNDSGGVLNLEDMVRGYFECLKSIHRNSIACHASGLEQCSVYLNGLLSAYKLPEGCFPVVFISSLSDMNVARKMEPLPLYLFKEIQLDLKTQFGLTVSSVGF